MIYIQFRLSGKFLDTGTTWSGFKSKTKPDKMQTFRVAQKYLLNLPQNEYGLCYLLKIIYHTFENR